MKNLIILPLLFTISTLLTPAAASAASESDARLTSVTISNISTTAPGTAADYTFSVVTSMALAAQTQIVISFFDTVNTEIAPNETGFDFTNIAMTNANWDASAVSWPDTGNTVASVNLNHEVITGSYFFTLTGIVNPNVDGTFQVGMATESPITSDTPYTKSAEFDIGAGGATGEGEDESNLENAIATLTLDRASSYIAGQRANYTLTIETNRDIDATESINVFIDTGEAGPDQSGFSFTGSTLDSNDFAANIVAEGNGVIAEIHPAATLTAGTYTFTLKNVRNSATPNTYYVRATTGAVEPGVGMAESRGFNIIGTPDKPTKLKIKKIKTTSATLSWKGDSVASSYKLQLSTKKGKKIKTFENLTAAKKVIKSKAKLLQAGKTYKFRARACNEAGCSKWSKYQSFKTKAARET